MKLMLLGATGLVGGRTLARALSSDAVTQVIAPTRRPLVGHAKLSNPVAARLEDSLPLLASHVPDAVICALGTTQAKAGSKEAFRHADHDLPLAFAQAAHAAAVSTFAIVTFAGAQAGSRFFYSRVKGEVERDVQAIGLRSLTICRPGLIAGERHEVRRLEGAAIALTRLLTPVLPGKYHLNPADRIAAALLDSALAARPGCHRIQAVDMR